jgi:hypothetical protein
MRYVNIAVEDELSEAVARKLVSVYAGRLAVAYAYRQGGYGYLKKNIRAFNHASRTTPFFVLTDLDDRDCAPLLLADWLQGTRKNRKLLLRVAVREVEAWLLGDRMAFSHFMGIAPNMIPQRVEELPDPKMVLLKLVSHCRKREIKEDILPPADRQIGPGYNSKLAEYVFDFWDPNEAAKHSPSLSAALSSLQHLAEME